MRLILLALVACETKIVDMGGPETSAPVETGASTDTVDTRDTGETAAPETADTTPPVDTSPPVETAEPNVDEESVVGMDDPAGWLFSDDEVHAIEIYFSEEAASSLNADPYTYVEGRVVINGMEVDQVGVRLKGKIGSFRYLSQKAAFKLDFNAYVEDQTFYGLKKLNLNNMTVDCSMLKEHLAYMVFRDLGIAAQRTGYAWVTVNGEPYGLYNVLEQPNMELLERYYDDPSGNLYDGKYVYYGGYSYTLLDFRSDLYTLYELEEGEDVDHADIYNIVAALPTYGGTSEYYDAVGAYVDWDKVLTYWAVEQWIGHNDGYVLNRNNNFIYFDSSDGKMEFIPWDMDYSFLNDSDWGMSWNLPYGLLAASCKNDTDGCRAAWKEAARGVVEAVDATVYEAYLDQWATLIADYVSADPRKECSTGSVAYYQDYLHTWVTGRNAYMTTFWGL